MDATQGEGDNHCGDGQQVRGRVRRVPGSGRGRGGAARQRRRIVADLSQRVRAGLDAGAPDRPPAARFARRLAPAPAGRVRHRDHRPRPAHGAHRLGGHRHLRRPALEPRDRPRRGDPGGGHRDPRPDHRVRPRARPRPARGPGGDRGHAGRAAELRHAGRRVQRALRPDPAGGRAPAARPALAGLPDRGRPDHRPAGPGPAARQVPQGRAHAGEPVPRTTAWRSPRRTTPRPTPWPR